MIEYHDNNKPMAKIIDFGISKDVQQNAAVSNIIGTFEYMAPEQFDPKASISPQTDIWWFGVLLLRNIYQPDAFWLAREVAMQIAKSLLQYSTNKHPTNCTPYRNPIKV